MKRLFGSVWVYVFGIASTLFFLSVIIYGLDITTPAAGPKVTTTSHLTNTASRAHYFMLNDEYAFGVYKDEYEGGFHIAVSSYTRNHVPFCFFCGWNRGHYGYEDGKGFSTPYRKGDLLYALDSLEQAYMGLPPDVFPTLNTKTGEFGYVTSLSEIDPDATDDKYKVTAKYIASNYGELSYYGPDDEDCQIAFAVIIVLYGVLIPWGLIAFFVRRRKRRRAEKGVLVDFKYFKKMLTKSDRKLRAGGITLLVIGGFVYIPFFVSDGGMAALIIASIISLMGLFVVIKAVKSLRSIRNGEHPVLNAIIKKNSSYLIWIYNEITTTNTNGYESTHCTVRMFTKNKRHSYSLIVKSIEDANGLLHYLGESFPDAYVGYDDEIRAKMSKIIGRKM